MTAIATKLKKGQVARIGDFGPLVQEIQLGLRSLGYPLKGTGYFGPATDVAVEAFQKAAGLGVDGEVGPRTAAALDRAMSLPRPGVRPSPSGGTPSILEVGRPLWLQAGMRLIGTKETPGSKDNRTIIDWAKEEGGAIAKAYTHDSIPWCALFANVCLTRAGLKGTETLWALDFAGKWPSVRLPDMAVGAFAPMLRDGGGHIMIVVGRDQHGNVMGLGGNQSDAVNIKPFARSRLNKGFWWPKGTSLPAKTGFASLPLVTSSGKVSSSEA